MARKVQTIATIPDRDEFERQVERFRATGWVDMEPHHRAFAVAYVQTLSHVRAAEEIGLDGQGLALLRNPLVATLIADMQEWLLRTELVTKQFVLQKAMELLPKLMGEEPVDHVVGGVMVHGKKFHASESKALLEFLGKHVGIGAEFSPGGRKAGAVNINLNFKDVMGGQKKSIEISADDYQELLDVDD